MVQLYFQGWGRVFDHSKTEHKSSEIPQAIKMNKLK